MFKSLFLISAIMIGNPDTDLKNLIDSSIKLRESNCDSAFVLLDDIDPSYLSAQSLPDQAEVTLQKGLAKYCLGEYDKTLPLYQTAVDLFDSAEMPERGVLTLNLIGTLQKKQGLFDVAQTYYEQGLELAKKNNDDEGIGNSLNNIGLVYLQQDQIHEAKKYFLESTTYKIMAQDTLGLSYNYDNLGQVYGQNDQLDSAIYYFELAADYKNKVGERVGGAIVQNNIGEALLIAGQAKRAEAYFQKALIIAKETSFADFEQHVLLQLSKVYEELGNMTQAFDLYKQHVSLNDSLFNIRKTKAIAELETKYETAKKEQQITLQQAEIEEHRIQNQRNLAVILGLILVVLMLVIIVLLTRSRSRKKQAIILKEAEIKLRETQIEAAISSQEKERTRFAKDLHDGFGQMISVLNLNLKSLEDGDKDKHEVFESSSKVLDEMYQELKGICFNLMPQTLIKHGITAAINEFAGRINNTGKYYIQTDFFGMEDRLTDVQEISLYRITQEWVNNILKYSDASKVTVQITRDEEEITLLIEDDGSGFDLNVLKSGKGNGWKNMNSRANLINGELEVETTPGMRGNTLIVNVPVAVRIDQSIELVK
ncbi:tetratricopeptide repeat-containing sensor histidine kinase [Marinoscillum pacificum]|uniref:tetratricopeptide repeat-containing sensor histidine kinase n=1 Tax=Marinoscillum pacificum TaxID=392723 RepID=UPI00215838A1|nr:tetratricopeptide repeat protein [Marinoscillum pacificum]